MNIFLKIVISLFILLPSLFYFFTKGRLTIVNNLNQPLNHISYEFECSSKYDSAPIIDFIDAQSKKAFMLPFMLAVPCDGTLFINLVIQNESKQVDCGVYMGFAERYTIKVDSETQLLICENN